MKLVVKLLVNATALYIVSFLVDGVVLSGFSAAIVAVIIIALINTLIKPILVLLTLPITILSLGLFTFVINALLLLLAGNITPGFEVVGFGTALIASILLTIISTILQIFIH